jgi:hypothetical protein
VLFDAVHAREEQRQTPEELAKTMNLDEEAQMHHPFGRIDRQLISAFRSIESVRDSAVSALGARFDAAA